MTPFPARLVATLILLTSAAAAADLGPMPDSPGPGELRVEITLGQPPTVGWELGWALAHPTTGDAALVRRALWKPLAGAIDATSAGEEATRHLLDDAEVLIRVTPCAAGRCVALLIPDRLLLPHTGKWTFGLETNFSRVRTSTSEITTWPLALSVEAWEEPRPDRRVEGSLVLGRELTERRVRDSVRDEQGDLVGFRDQPSETLRDARLATARGAWFATLGHEPSRRELGVSIEVLWEEDEIDLVQSRTVALVGLEWRRTSTSIDGQVVRGAVKLGTTRSEYLVIEEDAEGETSRSTERHDLPVWQVELAATSPLWLAAGVPVLSGSCSVTWQQSLERSGGSDTRPAKLEALGTADLGLVVHTPIGVELAFVVHAEYRELPGAAGEQIDDLSWSTGARSTLRLAF